jgi:radical SAM superfamily enzyme YgiQ (UPF0313 family)
MQTVSFISLYDDFCLDIRYASSMLKFDGHRFYITLFKGIQYVAANNPISAQQIQDGAYYGSRVCASTTEVNLLLENLKKQAPDLVVVSFASVSHGLAQFLTGKIKSELNKPVLWCGADSTCSPADNIEHVDMLCIGETEYPVRYVVDAMDKGEDPSLVHSIWSNVDGVIKRNQLMAVETKLDNLPFPDFDIADKTVICDDEIIQALYPPHSNLRTNLIIMASRGCLVTCPYCGTAHDDILYQKNQLVRLRSVDNVIEEIRYRLQTWPGSVERIEFHDVELPLDREWITEFASRYATEIALPFFGFVKPNQCDPEAYKILRDAGMFAMILRVPSGGERVLREIFKQEYSRECILSTAHNIHNAGIKLLCEFVKNNPLENEAEKLETLDLICDLPHGFSVIDNIPLTFYKNCQLWRKSSDSGAISRFASTDGEHAMQAVEDVDHLFWDCLYKLAQFDDFDKDCLRNFVNDGYMREKPAILEEIVVNLYKTVYLDGNPMADKDNYVQQLRWRIMHSENLSRTPAVKNIRKLANIFGFNK